MHFNVCEALQRNIILRPKIRMDINDKVLRQLVESAAGGNGEAFDVLFSHLYDRVYRYARRLLEDDDLAHDTAANTFYLVLTHLKGFRYKNAAMFYGWIFQIARNEIYKCNRNRKKYTLLESWLQESYVDEQTVSVQDAMDIEYDMQHVRQAMSCLSERQREIIELYYFANAPQAVIAKVLDINQVTVRVDLHRAITKLKQLLLPLERKEVT
jgi:RNA polymerase sigma factor (sigma-70 family)